MENFLHMRDLYDLHLHANALLSAETLLLGTRKAIVSKHPGIAAGADFIGHVHRSLPLCKATIAIALLLGIAQLADSISSNPSAKHHDNLQDDIDHVSHSR